jgi:CHAT domain-containing protein
VLRWLWQEFAVPLIDTVGRDISSLVLVPVGALAVLPFHAAGVPGSWLLDRFAVRYGITACSAVTDRKLELETVGSILSPARVTPRLRFAELEAALVAQMTGQAVVSECTPQSVVMAISRSDWIHVSSHFFALSDGFSSALQLSDAQELSVADFEVISPSPRGEAFVAACSARSIGLDLLDEVIGIPNALLSIGFRRVVAASWPINDLAACITTVDYYIRRAGLPSKPPIEALRESMRFLRDTSLIDIAARFQLSFSRGGTVSPEAERLITFLRENPTVRLDDPVYWAPLAVTGN